MRLAAIGLPLALACIPLAASAAPGTGQQRLEYRLLATEKTSTMQKELNEAASAGFRFAGVSGGPTAFGGNQTVVVMSRDPAADPAPRYDYRLLATSKTSTMQKELQEAADAGFGYRGQAVFGTEVGGDEVVVILERERDAKATPYEYRLLATSRTSTMEKELLEASNSGYEFLGVTVGETAFGGHEVVAILRRPRA
jgi:hypothetical protein